MLPPLHIYSNYEQHVQGRTDVQMVLRIVLSTDFHIEITSQRLSTTCVNGLHFGTPLPNIHLVILFE